ncbi:hypothetical protein Ccr5_gp090 [Caulobacter phage Ccr5]|nr:hypothetical protein Ccr5_gp090 [Caulobacter phage Ccr5]
MAASFFADSNRARMRYIKENNVVWGVTPASGVSRELRYTGSTVNAQKDTTLSEEIRADRMVSEIVEVAARTTGEINIEFSAGSHDDLLEAFMYGAWTRPMTFDSVQGVSLEWADTDTLYVKGKNVTPYFFAGRRVRTQGFINVANNGYWQIDTITFNAGANRTEINMSTSTAVAERGTAYSALYDANDVIVLNNTAIRAGTAGEAAFDSNGTNAFAAAIAAGQLSVGQKIFVEGLGFETGTVVLAGLPTAGARVQISDGVKTVPFQFGGSAAQPTVVVALGADETETAQNLADAINKLRVRKQLEVGASAATGTVTLRNLLVTGGSIIETVADANVTVTNFSGGDASLRGVFTIEALTDDKITVNPAPATLANTTAKVNIKGSMLRNPFDPDVITAQSFTFETGFEDVDQYYLADGMRIGTVALNIAANSILTGSFGLQGRASTRQNTSKLGEAPYTALQTTATPVANATVNVGKIAMNGEELSTAVQSIAINGTNNLRDQMAVGYKFPAGIGAGRMEISGSLVAYFADGNLWDKFINHETVSVSFPLTDVLGNHYEFTIPAANFSTDTVNPAGGNQDIMENLEYTAKRDPVTDCQFQIDRYSSIFANTN